MKPQLYWIEGPWKGRLAISSRPRGGDWLADEIQAWKDARLDTVVSTLEALEETELDLTQEQSLCQAQGIAFIAFPIADRNVPGSREKTLELMESLVKLLDGGGAVGIHCRQGIGRSSLLAACLLVSKSLHPKQAFEKIGLSRGCPVPDTSEQRDWVTRFAREKDKLLSNR